LVSDKHLRHMNFDRQVAELQVRATSWPGTR